MCPSRTTVGAGWGHMALEVDEAAAFGVGGVELAVQAGQLGGE